MTQATLDEWQAEALAKQGIQQVTENGKGWQQDALKAVRGFCTINQGCHDQAQIRVHIERQCGQPHHPNAWGALFRSAVSQGFLIRTEVMQKSRIPSTHGRMVPVFKVNDREQP